MVKTKKRNQKATSRKQAKMARKVKSHRHQKREQVTMTVTLISTLKIVLDSIALSPQASTSDDVFEDSEFVRQVEEIKSKHEKITDDEIDMYREMFKQFDINGDGSVQKSELREALKSSSKREIESSEIEAIFTRLDLDNDQQISFVEFARMFQMLIVRFTINYL